MNKNKAINQTYKKSNLERKKLFIVDTDKDSVLSAALLLGYFTNHTPQFIENNKSEEDILCTRRKGQA